MSYEESKKRHEAQRARVEQALGINETQSVAPVNLGDVLKHLTPDTIRTIIIELTAAENNKWFHGEFKPSETTLQVRDFCVTYMDAKWTGDEVNGDVALDAYTVDAFGEIISQPLLVQ